LRPEPAPTKPRQHVVGPIGNAGQQTPHNVRVRGLQSAEIHQFKEARIGRVGIVQHRLFCTQAQIDESTLSMGRPESLGGGDRDRGNARTSGADHGDQRSVPWGVRCMTGLGAAALRELGAVNRAGGPQKGVEEFVGAEVRTNRGVGSQRRPVVRQLGIRHDHHGHAVVSEALDEVSVNTMYRGVEHRRRYRAPRADLAEEVGYPDAFANFSRHRAAVR
jgi:hypothetical protein